MQRNDWKHKNTQFSLVIMKVFLYDVGVPGTVHFLLFEVPLEPYLNEGGYCNKQTPLQLRVLKVFTSCFMLLEKSSPWKVLYFFKKILCEPQLMWVTEKEQEWVI